MFEKFKNNLFFFSRTLFVTILLITIAGCTAKPPENTVNLCEIFREKRSWYKSAKDMNEKWGVPIHVPMAMMYQESSFKSKAKPPRDYVLFGLVPWGRVSSAYGYSQAKTLTWSDYKRETKKRGADRDKFSDAIDFMGWFISKTQKINGVSKWDAYHQYLNYHEGWGGYKNKTYNKKKWLIEVSKKVDRRSKTYSSQLKSCQKELDKSWLWRTLFGA
jgi:hypothetical protein